MDKLTHEHLNTLSYLKLKISHIKQINHLKLFKTFLFSSKVSFEQISIYSNYFLLNF